MGLCKCGKKKEKTRNKKREKGRVLKGGEEETSDRKMVFEAGKEENEVATEAETAKPPGKAATALLYLLDSKRVIAVRATADACK